MGFASHHVAVWHPIQDQSQAVRWSELDPCGQYRNEAAGSHDCPLLASETGPNTEITGSLGELEDNAQSGLDRRPHLSYPLLPRAICTRLVVLLISCTGN